MNDFLDEPFDTENEKGSDAFPLIPSGRYTAEIVDAKAGATKNGKGYAVSLNWSITEGDYENRTVFQNILIQHDSEEAQRIGRQKFKDVTVALGIKGKIEDLTVLHNIPCMIGIVIRKDKSGQYPDKNEVGRVMPMPAPYNGATREAIKEAQKVQPAFKAVHEDLNDELPPF